MGLDGGAVGGEGDIDKLLVLEQRLESRRHIFAEVVPFQAKLLLLPAALHPGNGGKRELRRKASDRVHFPLSFLLALSRFLPPTVLDR